MHLARLGVDFELAETDRRALVGVASRGDEVLRRGGGGTSPPPWRGSSPRREGLREVVVGADLETDQSVDLLAPRGDDHDVGVGEGAQLPADLDPVEVGEGEVERDEVGLDLLRQRDPSAPVAVAAR